MPDRLTRLIDDAEARFGHAGAAVRAPGRVNLIGDHTDYQDGFVLPMAIERDLWCVANRREDRILRVISLDVEDAVEISLDDLAPGNGAGWGRYPAGVAWALEQAGHRLAGLDAVMQSTVPIGSGLSSSAAIELAALWAFGRTSGFTVDPVTAATICRRAENEYVGVASGIMDQYVSANGQAGHAILIDCRTLTHRAVPLPAGATVVIAESGIRHELAKSGYNDRRAETDRALAAIQQRHPEVRALRDATAAMLGDVDLPAIEAKRARHVVTENARVLAAADALEAGDITVFGRLMIESHHSLRDDFQVSIPEIDTLVEAALAAGAAGSRITGGGFGGATVSLVTGDTAAFVQQVGTAYTQATGRTAEFFVTGAADGAGDLLLTSAGDGYQREQHRLADGRYFVDYRFTA